MSTNRIFKTLLAAALAAGIGMPGAQAGPPPAAAPSVPELVYEAAADCYTVGQAVAAQNGGQLAAARQAKRGGRNVCVIVVLIPAKNGQRGRRQEFIVPQ
ncbi:MAG: hypothetical protein R3D45_05680 [Rhizobiaceae bacterium]